MYCIFARESVVKMGGNRGKLASMAGHAYLHSFWDSCDEDKDDYNGSRLDQAFLYQKSGSAFKITLIVDTVEELIQLKNNYDEICGTSLVIDSARTVFTEPTIVCLGIGPISEDNIGEDLESLKVFI